MAVPNTTTFSLQDVVDEVNPTTDDLVDCFADADSKLFDINYEGSKNQLNDFRNYGGIQTYWNLSGCTTAGASTKIDPSGVTNRRYVKPGGPNVFYTWNGTTTVTATPPANFDENIQITGSGLTGCP